MPNIVTVTANQTQLSPETVNAGTRGSFGQTRLAFNFSGDWDGMTITVVFHPLRGAPVKIPYLPGTVIDIPEEIMLHNGELSYVVSGVLLSGGELVEKSISLTGKIRVAFTLGDAAGNTRKITADTYDLFLAEAKNYVDGVITEGIASGDFKGDKGDRGDPGPRGEKGERGEPGAPDVEVEAVEGGALVRAISPSGTTEAMLYNGTDGQDGADGQSFVIKGYYNTFAELNAAHPEPAVGDVYGVGTESPYDVYIWDGVNLLWVNNGSVSGVKGDPGEPGEDGEDGYTPVRGTDYWTDADKAEIVQDVLDALPEWMGGNY